MNKSWNRPNSHPTKICNIHSSEGVAAIVCMKFFRYFVLEHIALKTKHLRDLVGGFEWLEILGDHSYYLALEYLIPFLLVAAEIKWPINQFEPQLKSRQQTLAKKICPF